MSKNKSFTLLEITNSHGRNNMQGKKLEQKKSLTGFTMIELLVVMGIIGLISSIVLVNIGLPRQKQKAGIAKVLDFSHSVQNILGIEAVGIWEFDEGSGTVATDRSGYRNNGTISGATYATDTPQRMVGSSPGKYALRFNGTSDYLDAGNGTSLNSTGTITIEAWVKANQIAWSSFVSKRYNSDGAVLNGGYGLGMNNGGAPLFQIDNMITAVTSFGSVLSVDTWYHLVGVADGTKVYLYQNGVIKDKQTYSSYTNSSFNLTIGRSGGGYEFFNGLIDEVRIYKQALTIGQIRQHYAEGLERHQNLATR
jgi:prepilin-type N-terminal cleavage/methylation domain-containing protein